MNIPATFRLAATLALLAQLAACGSDSKPTAAPPRSVSPDSSLASDRGVRGREVYARVCGRCHDMGLNGAPRTESPEDWVNRSSLWQAVLAEHAEEGYLRMPERGGDPSLTDADIGAATDYMMSLVYPERALQDDE